MTTDGFPPYCYSNSVATPVLQAGVKIVNRRGLVVAPEIRLEVINTSLRVGVTVGWARFKRTSGRGRAPGCGRPARKLQLHAPRDGARRNTRQPSWVGQPD